MLDDHGFEIYEESAFPIAYLLTFLTFGTWLHGDERGSYTRRYQQRSSKYISPNVPLKETMETELKQSSLFSAAASALS